MGTDRLAPGLAELFPAADHRGMREAIKETLGGPARRRSSAGPRRRTGRWSARGGARGGRIEGPRPEGGILGYDGGRGLPGSIAEDGVGAHWAWISIGEPDAEQFLAPPSIPTQ